MEDSSAGKIQYFNLVQNFPHMFSLSVRIIPHPDSTHSDPAAITSSHILHLVHQNRHVPPSCQSLLLVVNSAGFCSLPHAPYATSAELLLAALLYCVPFGDRNPKIRFFPMHSRFRRCGIFPLVF